MIPEHKNKPQPIPLDSDLPIPFLTSREDYPNHGIQQASQVAMTVT